MITSAPMDLYQKPTCLADLCWPGMSYMHASISTSCCPGDCSWRPLAGSSRYCSDCGSKCMLRHPVVHLYQLGIHLGHSSSQLRVHGVGVRGDGCKEAALHGVLVSMELGAVALQSIPDAGQVAILLVQLPVQLDPVEISLKRCTCKQPRHFRHSWRLPFWAACKRFVQGRKSCTPGCAFRSNACSWATRAAPPSELPSSDSARCTSAPAFLRLARSARSAFARPWNLCATAWRACWTLNLGSENSSFNFCASSS